MINLPDPMKTTTARGIFLTGLICLAAALVAYSGYLLYQGGQHADTTLREPSLPVERTARPPTPQEHDAINVDIRRKNGLGLTVAKAREMASDINSGESTRQSIASACVYPVFGHVVAAIESDLDEFGLLLNASRGASNMNLNRVRAASLRSILVAGLKKGQSLALKSAQAIIDGVASQSGGINPYPGSPAALQSALWLLGLNFWPVNLAEDSDFDVAPSAAAESCQEVQHAYLSTHRPFVCTIDAHGDIVPFCETMWYRQWGAALVRLGAWAAINSGIGAEVGAADSTVACPFSPSSHVFALSSGSLGLNGLVYGIVFEPAASGGAASDFLLPWRPDSTNVAFTSTMLPLPSPTPLVNALVSNSVTPSPTPSLRKCLGIRVVARVCRTKRCTQCRAR